MKNSLKPYNDNSSTRLNSILELEDNKIYLTFVLEGKLDNYFIPEASKLQRVDGLWKSTCFEFFFANTQKEVYYELNFSSSLEWNFYYLSAYRADVQEVELITEPKIEIQKNGDRLIILFELKIEAFSLQDFDIYNVASILLTKENERTFWSIKHEDRVPNFHHRDNFLEIK